MDDNHRIRLLAVQDTLADYCKDRIDRASAQRILELSGCSKDGARVILDAADKNLTLKGSYKAGA
jgi:hypothetical protein